MPNASFEQRLLGQFLAGKYKVLEAQASGFFGTVFRAEQYFCRERVRPVAIKVSRQTGLTEETAPLVFRDALVLARLLASSGPGVESAGRQLMYELFTGGAPPERAVVHRRH